MPTRFDAVGATTQSRYKNVFTAAAIYDGVLGGAFFLFAGAIYRLLAIALPENTGYLELCAAFVFAQGVGYWYVSRNMVRNVDLVKVGLICKVAYSAVAAYYLAIGQLPHMIFAVFGVIDLLFAVAFARFLALARPT